MFEARKPCRIRWFFTPQVQSDSKHFDEECRDYLPSDSSENQSEDDHESSDDGFDWFTDHQVHLSTSRQWLCSSCMTSLVFFSPIDWNNFYCKIWIIVHFFVLKHEKQTLSYFHTKFEGDRNNWVFFFSNMFCGSTRFSASTLKITWAWEVDITEITWYE